jgi:predicted nucleic acid-binding Zn ribbon protein
VSAVEDSWDPDGTELARALLARVRADQRANPARTRTRTKRRFSAGRGRATSTWSGAAADERDPQPLENAVERLVDEHGWGEDIAVHAVIARWEQIVGADLAAHVTTEQYADGELTVRADSTAWATQVKLLAPNLVRRLNEEIGHGSVTRVIVLGPHAPSWRKGPRTVRGRGPRDTYG